jgi:hypothetical protein
MKRIGVKMPAEVPGELQLLACAGLSLDRLSSGIYRQEAEPLEGRCQRIGFEW